MARLRKITDEPSTPPVLSQSTAIAEYEDEEIEEAPEAAEYVRMVTYVGQYPAGSVLPATHFEQLERLLGVGAVVYEPKATRTSIVVPGGGPDNTDLTSSALLSAPQYSPSVAVTPDEILGHMAMLAPKSQVWVADQTNRIVPNTTDTPIPALNTADHTVTDDITVTL